MASDLPIDGDGACMKCKTKPPAAESLTCHTCATPWHVQCLAAPPKDYDSAATWLCPDCSPIAGDGAPVNGGRGGEAVGGGSGGLVAAVRAIEADETLTEKEKAVKRQELMSGKKGEEEVKEVVDERLMCLFCREVLDRPVTAPCGHNFCLKCFQKWVCLEKRAKVCVKCRAPIPKSMASQPRINSALVVAIRMAKTAKPASLTTPTPAYHFIGNENRPEAAFRTERAKKAGKANACCGQIFVTIAPDHFGPILAEHDPKRNKGVLVGESWEDRMEVRQWGVHFPHVAGIAGQSNHGAQSVALSGGYEDDEDHGEWFLYTGSGGRDLSGNKRTNKDHSSHQTFEKYNEALRVSCKRGYPVRVVRSHKEKRSAYAPETGVRYDGIYRIEKCWRKVARQGFKVCRYLFVRCDNEPAPWASDEQGDRPRPLPVIEELKEATDVTVRKESPAWDYDEGHGWKWMKSPPQSKKHLTTDKTGERKRGRKHAPSTGKEKLLKEFSCLICRKVMTFPLTTPCAHNFCKLCLLEAYADQSFIRERTRGGRTLRAQKVVKKCPGCPNDISDFLQNPQVNRDLMEVIESLQKKIEEENAGEDEDVEESSDGGSDVVEKTGDESDVVEGQKSSNDDADIVAEELNEEGSDGNGMEVEEKKIESTNGDSEVHAANSETEENGGDCQSPVKKQGSRKRKQTGGRKRAGKKTKKSGEASNDVEVTNEELKDTAENSIVKEDGSEGGDGKRENQAWANASASLSPSTQNRRVTRQSKVHS